MDRFEELLAKQEELIRLAPHGLTPNAEQRVTAGLGLIEEVLEYLSATGWKPWRPHALPLGAQLEELTDMLFYYLEMVIFSGFSWEQIVTEYFRKHAVNLKRYEDGAKGDYTWDKRAEKGGL